MGRKIILLSDGTGNSAAKVWRTNVWRTFEALDLSGNDQVALYDDGVGTSSFKPMALLGGAFGLGLRRNVIALYKFACRNYRDADDELFGFGFSRGAFTIRIVMGLIDSQGLVKADNEAELHSLASAAYRAYRRDRYHNLKFEAPYQWIRNKFGPHYPPKEVRRNIKIRFVGVWDTVAAYGMPVDEMTRGIHNISGRSNCRTSICPPSVTARLPGAGARRGTHHLPPAALGRNTRAPWSKRSAGRPGGKRFIKDERISQVWFAGVHTNVGGGYPDDALAYIPFVWMITEAQRCGLKFKSDYANQPANPDHMMADPDTFKNAISKRDKDGRLYDPRKGIGGYYRYGPRKLVPVFYPKKQEERGRRGRRRPRQDTRERLQAYREQRTRLCATRPAAILRVVKDDGEIVSPDNFSIAPSTEPFEASAAAAQRALAQEHVWNEVWKRRIAYFATVGATLWLLIFPLISSAQRDDEFTSPIRWVSDFVRFVGSFLPSFASTWIDGYARAPGCSPCYGDPGRRFCTPEHGSRGAHQLSWLRSGGGRRRRRRGCRQLDLSTTQQPALHTFPRQLKAQDRAGLFAVVFCLSRIRDCQPSLFNILDVAGQTCVAPQNDLAILRLPSTNQRP